MRLSNSPQVILLVKEPRFEAASSLKPKFCSGEVKGGHNFAIISCVLASPSSKILSEKCACFLSSTQQIFTEALLLVNYSLRTLGIQQEKNKHPAFIKLTF